MIKAVLLLILFTCGFADDCLSQPVPVPPPTPEATTYYKHGNILFIINLLWSLIVPAAIAFSGFGAKLRNFCQKISTRWLLEKALYTLFFLLIVTALTFPLDYFTDFVRSHKYGLSNQTFGRWFNHYCMTFAITTLLGIILVWILYGVIRKSKNRWWLYFGLLNFPLAILLVFIQPLMIAPLFNDFGPMKNKQLEEKILHLAARAGIEGGRVYEVDMSADTNQVNAYVTGIGASKRIVIWDTAIRELSEDQLLFVMGHEMGHYVLHHMWWGILVYTLITIIVLYLVHVGLGFCTRRWGERLGFREVGDIASLPLIMFLYALFSFLLSPLGNLFSQKIEHDADTFGLELTHLNEAAATGFVKLSSTNLGYPWPGPFYMVFRTGHPSIGARITFFNEYKPWCSGQPLKYGEHFDSHRQ